MTCPDCERTRKERDVIQERLEYHLKHGDDVFDANQALAGELDALRGALRLALGALHAAGYDSHPDAVRARDFLEGASGARAPGEPEEKP